MGIYMEGPGAPRATQGSYGNSEKQYSKLRECFRDVGFEL